MRIRNLLLKNFLSFGENVQQIDFTRFDTIVGPNDSGKTNVFRAIAFLGDIFRDRVTETRPYYHNGDVENPFELRIGIEFDEEEIEALSNFLVCSALMGNVGLQGAEDQNLMENLKREIVNKYGKRLFDELFRNVALEVRGRGQEAYPVDIMVRIAANNKELFIHKYGIIAKHSTGPRSYTAWFFAQLLVDELRRQYPEIVNNYLTRQTMNMPTFDYTPPHVFDLMLAKLDTTESGVIDIMGFAFNDFEGRVASVPEFRKLRNFLRRRGFTEGSVNLFDIITVIYNSSIVRTSDIRSKPRAFLRAEIDLESITGHFYNLTGEELPIVLFKLKNSSNPNERRTYAEIAKWFSDITAGLEFDVGIRTKRVATESQNELVPFRPSEIGLRELIGPAAQENIRLLGTRSKQGEIIQYELFIQVVKGNLPIPLDFAAAGIFEALLLLTTMIGHKQKVILLDEPALNLHPIFQKKILELVEKTISENSNQVILITHSPYLIKAEKLHNIWRFSGDGSTKVINLGKTVLQMNQEDERKIIQQLRNSEIRSLLFSKGVILVEGPSDKIVVEKLDKHLSLNNKGANIEDKEWAVVEMGSKDNLATFIRLVTKLDIPYVAVMDYDALMRCETAINTANGKIKTASIPFYLYRAGLLTSSEVDTLRNLEGSIEQHNGQFWYPQKSLDVLFAMSKSHDIFVFTNDLEGVLQSPVTRKDSKPLHALDAVLKKISDNKIPKEFYSMIDFIKQDIAKYEKIAVENNKND